jgi:hypothetical protein
MITRADLEWWLSLAPTLDWTWAKTYAARAPHWYVVEGHTPGLDHDDFIRAGRVIRSYGEPAKFWLMTNLYLFDAERQWRYWCMWSRPPQDDDATLINRATTERIYGPQQDFDQDRLGELRLLPLDDDGWRR